MTMTRRTRVLTVVAALVAVSLMLADSVPSAWAHTGVVAGTAVAESTPPPAVLPVAAPAPLVVPAPVTPTSLGPVIALILALGTMLATRRRTLATALVPILVVLAVETGVHSVHHLADQKTAATCVVALASAHVHGTAEPSPAVHDLWIAAPIGAVVAPAPERPGARPLRPDEGRAPPAA